MTTHMKLLSVVLMTAALVAVMFVPAQPATAQSASCYEEIFQTIVAPHPFRPGVLLERDVVIGIDFNDDCYSVGDDRVNASDLAAEAAIYCRNAGVAIWDIDSLSRGTMAFLVAYEVIDAVGTPTVNTLIAEYGGFRLYKLTSGELQVNSPPDWQGKEYVFTWAGCPRPTAP